MLRGPWLADKSRFPYHQRIIIQIANVLTSATRAFGQATTIIARPAGPAGAAYTSGCQESGT